MVVVKYRRFRMRAAIIVFTLLAVVAFSRAEELAAAPAAPPVKCEIQLTAWCIDQGSLEISDRLVEHSSYSRIWTVRGFFKPKAPLVVLEPYGCRDGVSDMLSALKFDHDFKWDGKRWNRLSVRLRAARACDLELLIPRYAEDPSGEAFFQGLSLIQACTNIGCDGSSLGEFRAQFEDQWREGRKPPVFQK